jgi:polar amino acid transport system substrate-binding protein
MTEAARSGRADGFIDDDVVMVPFAEQDPDFVLGFIGDILHPWAAGVAPGNDRLRQRLDDAIGRVVADGRLKRVWSTWIPSLPFPFEAGE